MPLHPDASRQSTQSAAAAQRESPPVRRGKPHWMRKARHSRGYLSNRAQPRPASADRPRTVEPTVRPSTIASLSGFWSICTKRSRAGGPFDDWPVRTDRQGQVSSTARLGMRQVCRTTWRRTHLATIWCLVAVLIQDAIRLHAQAASYCAAATLVTRQEIG